MQPAQVIKQPRDQKDAQNPQSDLFQKIIKLLPFLFLAFVEKWFDFTPEIFGKLRLKGKQKRLPAKGDKQNCERRKVFGESF